MSQEEIIAKVREAVESDPNKDYIQSIYLFGSYLHGDATEKSDVDLLYEATKAMGLFKMFEMQHRFEQKIGRKVDLIEKDSLDKYIKDDVLAEAKKIYENRRYIS
jgi:uncharacterized protein